MRVFGYECGKCGWEPSTVDELDGSCPRCHPRPVIGLKNEDFAPLPADGSYVTEHTIKHTPPPKRKHMEVADEIVLGEMQQCILGTTECAGCRVTILGTEGNKCVECQSKDGGMEFIPKTRAVGRTTDKVAPKEPVLSEGQTEADVDQAQKQPLSAPSALTHVTLPPESGWKITHQVQEVPEPPAKPIEYRRHRSYHPALNRNGG